MPLGVATKPVPGKQRFAAKQGIASTFEGVGSREFLDLKAVISKAA